MKGYPALAPGCYRNRSRGRLSSCRPAAFYGAGSGEALANCHADPLYCDVVRGLHGNCALALTA